MIDNDILAMLKERYSTCPDGIPFDETVVSLDGVIIKQNKSEQLYIHHADSCGSEVIIPYGIDLIKPGAFRDQAGLKRVVIRANVTEIPRYAFVNCSSLTEIVLPESVISIGQGAFEDCSALEHITIPASVREIKPEAFAGCKALKTVRLLNPETAIGKKAFMEGCAFLYGDEAGDNLPDPVTDPTESEPDVHEEPVIEYEAAESKPDVHEESVEECEATESEPEAREEPVEEYDATEPEPKVYEELVEECDVTESEPGVHEEPVEECEATEPEPEAHEEPVEEYEAAESEPDVHEVPVDEYDATESEPDAHDEPDVEHDTEEDDRPKQADTGFQPHSMKMLFCSDVRLGAICTENLDLNQSHKWRAARNEKLAHLFDQAAQNNAAYVALFGLMFGQERVSESVIDGLFDAVKENPDIQTLAFLNAGEYKRIAYRNDIPDNIRLLCTQVQDSYADGGIALRINKGAVELQLADNDALTIRRDDEGKYIIRGMQEEYVIPFFEPAGFEDAEGLPCGYGVLGWEEDSIGLFSVKQDQKYAYQAVEIRIIPEDDEKEIERKIYNAVREIDYDTFLRITLVGRSAFSLMISGDALKKQLQKRIFFVEVYDNTVMDIDEEAFENDISLRSEFVRLALQDGSLSESERNRLISCGWNALSGKGVASK